MQKRFKVNVRRSCRLALLQLSAWYQKSEAHDQSELRLRIREIDPHPRFGSLRVLVMLKRGAGPLARSAFTGRKDDQMLDRRDSGAHGDRSVESRCGVVPHTARKAHEQRAYRVVQRSVLRNAFLDVNELTTMQDAREKLTAWQHDHNHHRPDGSLGHLVPSAFVKKRSGRQTGSRPTAG